MTSDKVALSYLGDAEIIIDEAKFSYEKKHWHRVIRKCQEASELAVKGLFKYFGIEHPKSHIIGRALKKELGKLNILSHEELDKIAYFSDSLAFDREPSFYGSIEGVPASELFDEDDAKEAIDNVLWVVGAIRKVIEK